MAVSKYAGTKQIPLACLAVTLLISICLPAHAAAFRAIENISYLQNGSPQNKLDLYLPKEAQNKLPLVIFVHGGGWSKGDKSHIGCKPEYFTSLGFAFASVNYRLSPDPLSSFKSPDQGRIKYPVQQQDLAAAVAFLYKNSDKYGLDKSNLALMGHSAGAQIVTLISTDQSFLEAEGLSLDKIKALVSLDTVMGYDIEEAATQKGRGRFLYLNAFGSDPAVWKKASVVEHIAPHKKIPNSLIVSQQNPKNRLRAERVCKLLTNCGYKSYHYVAAGLDHEAINKELGVNKELSNAVSSFLKNNLKETNK